MICIEITLYGYFFFRKNISHGPRARKHESGIPISTSICIIKIRRRYCRFSYGRSLIDRQKNVTESTNFGKINTVIKKIIAKFGLLKHEEIAMSDNQKPEAWVVVLANDYYVTRSPDTQVSTYANDVATKVAWQNGKK